MKHLSRTLALAATVFVGTAALAHGRLETSTPAEGATLSPAPTEMKFRFSEPVEAAMSSVKLVGPGDKEVALDKAHADKDDPRSIAVAVPKLDAGAYRAQWATAGHDGHRVKGEIHFTVK
jgi:methionine-rich copper-binding protein CopC